VIGTAEYVAQEQMAGKPKEASDIYSLGVTCLHLLTGVSPFNLFDTEEFEWVWRDFLSNNPVDQKLGAVLDKMVCPGTKKRYRSAQAVLDELGGVNKPSNQPSTVYRYAYPRQQQVTVLSQVNSCSSTNSNVSWFSYESVIVNRRGQIVKRTPGQAKYYRENLGNGVYLDMVYIAGGSFLMGSPSSEKKDNFLQGREEPQHRVTVPEFWIGKYQVTQAQWVAIMGNNPAVERGVNRPVEQVGWDDCQDFCRKLRERTGKQYRLPSEAEWEYACRAGTLTPFSCGETLTTNLANYNGDYTYEDEGKGQYKNKTVEVGSFPPNPWGLYDMHGNVWEWCEDGWHDDYKGAPVNGSAWGSAWINNQLGIDMGVLRGGSWCFYPEACRSATRHSNLRDLRSHGFGLRLVME
jgi:formylglycine-generating enzyme required for sulfatase activity